MVSFSTRAASGLAALGFVAGASFLVAAPAQALIDPTACGYEAVAATDTVVSISPTNPTRGSQFTATAQVTSGGEPVDGGFVEFKYRDSRKIGEVNDGTASVQFTARPGNQQVRATYDETCIAGVAAFSGSEGTQILGVEQFAPPKTDDEPTIGGLADTGMNPAIQLVALTGAGLLTAGAATLTIRRRRVTI